MRLQKYLRDLGIGSLRECDNLIQTKKIIINNKTIDSPTYYLKENDVLLYQNKKYIFKNSKKIKYYIKLNKPENIICSKKDEYNRRTIFDLIFENYKSKLNYAGRLDKDSVGLVVLSNDGDFIYKITHPKFNIKKKYYVILENNIKFTDLKKIANGVIINKVKYSKFEYKILDNRKFYITLNEGKKHEIRNIFEYLNSKVIHLKRLSIGSISLDNLVEGEYMQIDDKKILNILNM